MLLRRHATLDPCRVPEVEQHLRSGCKTVSRKVEGSWRSFSGEATGFFERVNLLDQAVRTLQVGDVIGKWIIQPRGKLHQRREIFRCNICGDVGGLKLCVNSVLGRIIRSD